MPPKLPEPPKHLSGESSVFFTSVVESYELESHHLKLLVAACECLDRASEAREALRRDGMVHKDRHGNLRPHPCCQVERDNKALFSRLIRELALDVEAPAENRPPTIHGNAYRKAE